MPLIKYYEKDGDIKDLANEPVGIILKEIKSGNFSKRLDEDAIKGYPKLKEFNKKNNQNNLSKVQLKLSKIINWTNIL